MSIGTLKQSQQLINGRCFVIVTGPDGRIKKMVESKNLWIQGGRDLLASAVGQSDTDPGAQWMAFGSGASVASDDTTLTGELSGAPSRIQACFSHADTSYNWTMKATWNTLSVSTTAKQAGLLDSATGGDMFAKTSFAAVEVASQDTLTIKWTFSIE